MANRFPQHTTKRQMAKRPTPLAILRKFTSPFRGHMKPSFLIIGAQKAGTTALHSMLKRHPSLLTPNKKELHFFDVDERYAKGIDGYWRQFPYKPVWPTGQIAFEATPAYLYQAHKTASRIYEHLPKAICIATLRDPVKRAYSAWNMCHNFKGHPKHGWMHDPRPFARAVEDELAGRTEMIQHLYLACGHYAGQIAHFQDYFPARQLWIRSYKELKKDPDVFVGDILKGLGLPPMPTSTTLKGHRAGNSVYAEKLDRSLSQELYLYFAPELEKLRKILGHELDILEENG